MLTLCIPTYNRGLKVRDRLIELLPQLTDSVQVIVIDNASEKPAIDFISDIVKASPKINVIRNKYNIGMAANIARCIELAETEWLFILGDDDSLKVGSVRQILHDISAVDSSVDCIKYSSYCGENLNTEITDIEGILSNKRLNYEFVSNFFLISSTVLRVKKITSLNNIMDTLNSMVPHTVLIFELLIAGGLIKLSQVHIVDSTKSATSWSALHFEANLNLVSQFARQADKVRFRRIVEFFSRYLYFNPVHVFMCVHKIAFTTNRAYAAYVYRMILANCFVGKVPVTKFCNTFVLWVLFTFKVDNLLPLIFNIRGGAIKSKYEKFMI